MGQLPPSSQDLPYIQTFKWLFYPTQFFEENAQKYGDVFSINIGPTFRPQVHVSNPQLIEQIFAVEPYKFQSASKFAIGLLGKESLVAIDGERHRSQKKLLTPPFHGDRLRSYADTIAQIVQQQTSSWKEGGKVNLPSVMKEISFKAIAKTVFGLTDSDRSQQIESLLLARNTPTANLLQGIALAFPPSRGLIKKSPQWHQAKARAEARDRLIYEEIADKRAQANGSDILSLMISAEDENGRKMEDIELRDELMTLLFAGKETTAIALSWLLWWVKSDRARAALAGRSIEQQLLAELSQIDASDYLGLTRLPYLNAVCLETLRIYPAPMSCFNRIPQQDYNLGGFVIPAGVPIFPAIYLTHHREDLYPDPKAFRPERFLERQYAPHEYLPFGGGNRRCLGMAFALLEMKIVLATMLRAWNLELSEPRTLKPKREGLLLKCPDYDIVPKSRN
ncbi:cytochrome P450 [Merismopedia glauca]|uniref:Cytochrome P450 n=1 Tax=Merismopedia glauca CCAP 1448/3 TaxID=1296344 RepID=A0A2T1C9N2_9CYAN|nr:cytochrome P450 [Merismopedia glauca]PSB04975.1 cytochrome P450 [Merismopedia glauca CCAP 1448/3]